MKFLLLLVLVVGCKNTYKENFAPDENEKLDHLIMKYKQPSQVKCTLGNKVVNKEVARHLYGGTGYVQDRNDQPSLECIGDYFDSKKCMEICAKLLGTIK